MAQVLVKCTCYCQDLVTLRCQLWIKDVIDWWLHFVTGFWHYTFNFDNSSSSRDSRIVHLWIGTFFHVLLLRVRHSNTGLELVANNEKESWINKKKIFKFSEASDKSKFVINCCLCWQENITFNLKENPVISRVHSKHTRTSEVLHKQLAFPRFTFKILVEILFDDMTLTLWH